MLELVLVVFGILLLFGFVYSVLMIPIRIGEIRDLVECIDNKLEKLQKTRKSNDS